MWLLGEPRPGQLPQPPGLSLSGAAPAPPPLRCDSGAPWRSQTMMPGSLLAGMMENPDALPRQGAFSPPSVSFSIRLMWGALTASSPSPALSLSTCVLRNQVLRPPSQSWERRPLLSFSFRTWATKKEATWSKGITCQLGSVVLSARGQARPHSGHRGSYHTGLGKGLLEVVIGGTDARCSVPKSTLEY